MMRTQNRWLQIATGALASLSLVGCGGGGDDGTTTDPGTGTFYDYVQTEMKLPANTTDKDKFALDLDDDQELDNQLGNVIALLASNMVNMQKPVDEGIAKGDIILLHSLRADSLDSDSSVSWQVYVGDKKAMPDYSGAGTFNVAATSPTDARLAGNLVTSHYKGGPANVTLTMALVAGQPALPIRLVGTRIEGDVTADGCTNTKLGGAITKTEMDMTILPAITAMMNASIAEKPDDQNSKTILGIFDKDMDGLISEMEVKDNALIKSVLAPDVDMFFSDGVTMGHDDVDDSLSLGVGMACTKAAVTGKPTE